MTRVLSALVVLPIVVGTIWLLPPLATLLLAEIALVLAFAEYERLASRLGVRLPVAVAGVGAVATCAAIGWSGAPIDAVLVALLIASGALVVGAGRQGGDPLRDASAAVFASIYLGLPLGAMAWLRIGHGRETLLLLLVAVMASDTAQYYGGRIFGRRPLAPAISPKKTIEGAVAGFVAGTAVMVVVGRWWLPAVGPAGRGLLGATVVALGIAGDLFESALKRSARVKDASGLIPGHGGMLDRLDSLLFAAPVYWVFLRYTT